MADKDFITAFREEQGAQYSNLEGARSIDFGCFGQVLLVIYSKFLLYFGMTVGELSELGMISSTFLLIIDYF